MRDTFGGIGDAVAAEMFGGDDDLDDIDEELGLDDDEYGSVLGFGKPTDKQRRKRIERHREKISELKRKKAEGKKRGGLLSFFKDIDDVIARHERAIARIRAGKDD